MSSRRERELEKFLKCSNGFINHAADNKLYNDFVATPLVHDINGLYFREDFFWPRVANYDEYADETT